MGEAVPAEAEVREWFARATAFHKATLLDEAAALYEKILAVAPGNPQTLYFLGVLRHAQGNSKAAVGLLGDAAAARPGDAPILSALGVALSGDDRAEEALAAYDRAIGLAPGFAETHNHRAVALQKLGRLDAAIDGYRAAIALMPGYAEAYNNLGTALHRAGRPEEALDAYRAALGFRPAYFDALGNLGKLEAEQGQHEAAVATYLRLLERRPDDFAALSAVGDLLVALDREPDALGYYAAALELRPRDPVLLDRVASALLFLHRFEEAADVLATVVDIDDTLGSAWMHYGITLHKLGDNDAACQALKTAIARDPTLSLAYNTLGMILLTRGAVAEARTVFCDWQRQAPQNPTVHHLMAAVSGADVPERCSADYVVGTFAGFAKTFDRQLADLEYRGPQLLDDLLRAHMAEASGALTIADLGCGTGLCGPALRPRARRLIGVDLTPAMLERARRRALYDELVEADLVDFLDAATDRFDLLVSADTLVYFGNLAPVFAAAARALVPGGRLAFTLEAASDGVVLAPSGRFQHGEGPLRAALAAAGLHILELRQDVLRNEGGRPVQGLVVLAEAFANSSARGLA